VHVLVFINYWKVKVFVASHLLGCGTTSLYDWCPTFSDYYIDSKHWAPITHWCGTTSQM